RKEMVQCYNLLATNHRKLLNFEDALAYFQKALDLTDSAQDVLQFKNNLAVTYIDYGKYQKAVDILKDIIDDPSLNRTTTQYARVLDNLSYAKWLLDGRDETEALIKALTIRSQKNDRRGQISSYTHLGESNMKRNPDAAMAYFDTVINIARKIRMPRAETDALMFIMQLQPHNIGVRNRYIILKDSLEKEELMVKTQFAKYKYDDKQKQESILRLEMEKAEQTLLATRERSRKIMSYLGSITLLLGLSFAIYYFGQRTKRLKEETKTAKLVATLETEADMSRRLHDDFGAGLNQTMLMLQGDADKSKILDRLDGLYNQSRSFSREVNEVNTGPNFKEELSEMLRFSTTSQTNLIITGAKDMDWDSIQPLSKMVIYKILQELMINMGKHSNATLTTIGFKVSGNTLLVNYSDNGVGASKRELNSKNGLRNTEKRIQAIGGSITFDSDKGAGFNANMIVPV
ncbi:MAG: tetratricopeptide repeat protein, partial [Bacteroidota bacterium]|nr:tetratricopeptide repeat protein [Bacteroidota bacterium]